MNGHTRDLSLDANGNLLAVEEEVAFTALPAAVQSGLKTIAGKGTIGKVEAIT